VLWHEKFILLGITPRNLSLESFDIVPGISEGKSGREGGEGAFITERIELGLQRKNI